MLDVCLIATGHVSTTPRLVKEADRLRSAGYRVHVVASDHFPTASRLDEEILARARWKCTRVPLSMATPARLSRRLQGSFWRALCRCGLDSQPIAARALSPRHDLFVRTVLGKPARLYHAHGLPGLCIAAEAARRTGALLGFDAEDWHSEEQLPSQLRPGELELRRLIEGRLIPRCRHLSAASPLIAQAYEPLSRVEMLPVLNVFPLDEAPVQPVPHAARSRSLYWFSQSIGNDRGLESVVRAMPLLPPDWTLHLRGIPTPGYTDSLNTLAASLGLAGRIKWLDTAEAAEMARLASSHRIGLSTEHAVPGNKARCLSNKLFTYLLAGVPVLLSDTPAQRLIAPALDGAVRVARLEDPAALAAAIRELDTPEAAAEAWRLGQSRYNWNVEAEFFLRHISKTLNSPDAHPPHR
jgi:glycosyltransferase involved in cell wall biosynthesis